MIDWSPQRGISQTITIAVSVFTGCPSLCGLVHNYLIDWMGG